MPTTQQVTGTTVATRETHTRAVQDATNNDFTVTSAKLGLKRNVSLRGAVVLRGTHTT